MTSSPKAALPELFTRGNACEAGCCRVVRSRSLPPPNVADGPVYVRPMFQVLTDIADPELDDDEGMRVPADEYERSDRIFL